MCDHIARGQGGRRGEKQAGPFATAAARLHLPCCSLLQCTHLLLADPSAHLCMHLTVRLYCAR